MIFDRYFVVNWRDANISTNVIIGALSADSLLADKFPIIYQPIRNQPKSTPMMTFVEMFAYPAYLQQNIDQKSLFIDKIYYKYF